MARPVSAMFHLPPVQPPQQIAMYEQYPGAWKAVSETFVYSKNSPAPHFSFEKVIGHDGNQKKTDDAVEGICNTPGGKCRLFWCDGNSWRECTLKNENGNVRIDANGNARSWKVQMMAPQAQHQQQHLRIPPQQPRRINNPRNLPSRTQL